MSSSGLHTQRWNTFTCLHESAYVITMLVRSILRGAFFLPMLCCRTRLNSMQRCLQFLLNTVKGHSRQRLRYVMAVGIDRQLQDT